MQYAHSVEFKFRDVEAGTLSGYASVFGNVDHGSDKILPGAFRKSIMGRDKLPMLHEHANTVGVWKSLREDKHGLLVEGKISNTALGRDVRTLARDGALTGLSIGYQPKAHRYEGEIRVLESVDLLEVSLVSFPMNELAKVTSAKSLLARGEVPGFRELEAVLRSAGLSRRQAKRLLADGYSGMSPTHIAAAFIERMAARIEE